MRSTEQEVTLTDPQTQISWSKRKWSFEQSSNLTSWKIIKVFPSNSLLPQPSDASSSDVVQSKIDSRGRFTQYDKNNEDATCAR